MPTTTSFTELKVKCKDGLELYGRRYYAEKLGKKGVKAEERKKMKASKAPKPDKYFRIVCWHGWLDNVNTFTKFLPHLIDDYLLKKGGPDAYVIVDCYAFDLPSHGKSDHKSLDGPPMIVLMDFVYYMFDVLHGYLKWSKQPVIHIGHSFGATLGLMFASAFPMYRLVMMEAMGPESPLSIPLSFQNHITTRFLGKPPGSVYKSIEEAADSLCKSICSRDKKMTLSMEASLELIKGHSTILDDGRCQLTFDARMKGAAGILYLTDEQKDELYKAVAKQCIDEDGDLYNAESNALRIGLFLAKEGTPYSDDEINHFKKMIQPEKYQQLDGSHHFHMEEEYYKEVTKVVGRFLLGY